MTISARVIADSIQENGRHRLTTFVLRYPRFIHSEFMTHRVFSRNAASSRAIPIKKMIEQVMVDPAMPVFWGKNQSGMQAAEELGLTSKDLCKGTWLAARDKAVEYAEAMMAYGLHKQIANRILEPWMHIEVVATSTKFANFYALRDHLMAQPEFQALAGSMFEAHSNSEPKVLKPGEWHLPFIKDEDWILFMQTLEANRLPMQLPVISAARCARVSYLNHEGKKTTLNEDLALYERLMGGTPKHASPTEHQARVPVQDGLYGPSWEVEKYRSNLDGWVQFRKLIIGENISDHKGFKE